MSMVCSWALDVDEQPWIVQEEKMMVRQETNVNKETRGCFVFVVFKLESSTPRLCLAEATGMGLTKPIEIRGHE